MIQKPRLYSLCFLLFASILYCSCSKSGSSNSTTGNYPQLNILDVSQVRISTISTMQFYVYLNKSYSQAVTVDYTLNDGTANSINDYIAASGTVTIPANQTSAYINVQIKGDTLGLRQTNLQYSVLLSNPKNCTLSKSSAIGTIVTENGLYLTTDNTGYVTPMSYPGYNLVWSDEFSGSTLNTAVWNQEIGNGVGGWGNNELENYTSSTNNTFVSNGNLIIEARKENSGGGSTYTSGRLTTNNKKSFKFGRIDIRAKLPVGKGIWPALWMLGTNISSVGWPACGEMDIMELVGTYPSSITGTMHWKNTSGNDAFKNANYNLSGSDFSQQFHVFSVIWKQDSIKWYVDDNLYLSTSAADVGAANYPFNAEQFFIFNVAVGGNWPGSPDSNTSFPERMYVDYVRVFQ